MTRLNEIVYIATININMSNEDIQKLDEKGNEYQVQGEHGIVETRNNVEVLESNDLRYYVQQLISFVAT